MKKNLLVVIFVFVLISLNAKNYYVHSTKGKDTNRGNIQNSPWKTISKVNLHTFQPGDSIFFACDEVWFENFNPKGSGSPELPIVVTSFGEGNKPLFVGIHTIGRGVVQLYNQSYWEISDLEIVNNAKEHADRRGVEIIAENAGIIRQIHLKNLHIRFPFRLPVQGG